MCRAKSCAHETTHIGMYRHDRGRNSLHTTAVDVGNGDRYTCRYRGSIAASPTEAACEEKHKRHGFNVSESRPPAEDSDEMHCKYLRPKSGGTPMTPTNAVLQSDETRSSRLCCTHKRTSCSSNLGAEGCPGWQLAQGLGL